MKTQAGAWKMLGELTERDAWLAIAAAWDEAAIRTSGPLGCEAVVQGRYCHGLCTSVFALFNTDMISAETLASMQGRIGHLPGSGYRWESNHLGAMARANFCRHMAECSEGEMRTAV